MMLIPPIVMATIDVSTNNNIVPITDDNFRGRRTGAHEHRPQGRSYNDHPHLSLLCPPGAGNA